MSNATLEEDLAILERRAVFAKGLIALVVLTGIPVTVVLLAELNELFSTDIIVIDDLLLVEVIGVAYGLALMTSFVVVSFWIHRAHSNLIAADLDGLEYTPGWAIGWFAIPIANFWKPFQAMRELWNASHGSLAQHDRAAPGLLWAWWLTWVFSAFSSYDETISSLDVIGTVCTIASAITLWIIVDTITTAQRTMDISETFA